MKTKKSRERQHKPVKRRNTHQEKTDKAKYKTRLKQVLPFHSFINCFGFIPINNTDADLAASYASLMFILIVESP